MFSNAHAAPQITCGPKLSLGSTRQVCLPVARSPLTGRRQQITRSEASGVTEAPVDKSRVHEIVGSRWADGIPRVMGAHLMDSGKVAPISTSKGPGIDCEPHMFFYPESEAEVGVVQYSTVAGASKELTKMVAAAAKAAIKERGSFAIALTGGSLLKIMGALASSNDVDWANWHVFFGDERNVAHSSPDSTIKGAREGFLDKVAIPEANIHAIHEGLPVQAAAIEYEGQMLALPPSVLPRNSDGWPVMDMIVLGLGPDGHICSMFPNRQQTAAVKGWILAVSDSPKPPSERITMSMPVINAAKEVVFVAIGAGKAEIVQRVLEVQSLPGALPAQMVRPTAGTVTWLLDGDSAGGIGAENWSDSPKAYPRSNMVGGKKATGKTGEAE